MIRLVRLRTDEAIPEQFRGEKRIDQALTLLAAGGGVRTFDAAYWKKASAYWKKAKEQLKAESSRKCAYCEAPTAVVAHGDVEHFRPKSVYWWLAYCYDNYLFSCQLCNESFKGNEFPLEDDARRLPAPVPAAGATEAELREFVRRLAPDPLDDAAGMAWKEFEDALRGEGASLLNPYLDEPEEHFAWEADAALQEVAVRSASAASQRFHAAAERFYGLNRPDLLLERWKTFSTLSTLRKSFLSKAIQADPELRDDIAREIRRMMADEARFAGMCRYFVCRVWKLQL